MFFYPGRTRDVDNDGIEYTKERDVRPNDKCIRRKMLDITKLKSMNE